MEWLRSGWRQNAGIIVSLTMCLVGLGRVEASVAISEIMAADGNPLLDVDSDRSDWIELFNTGTETVDLAGWSLSDQENGDGAWIFPSVSLAPSGFLIVFASGKDCRDPGGELHTSFKLRRSGEFLQLRDAQGAVVSSFPSEFPRQSDGYSFGLSMATIATSAIDRTSAVRFHVPDPDEDLEAWKRLGFDDEGWLSGVGSIGFEHSNPPILAPFIDTDFSDSVLGEGSTVYARYRIEGVMPQDILLLRLRFDDGLVLYLNGRERYRMNAPTRTDYRSRASRPRETEDVLKEVPLVLGREDGLRAGDNVIAVHLLNARATDRDFLLSLRGEVIRLDDSQLGEAVYFQQPTPGLPNIGGTTSVLSEPQASLPAGVYAGTIEVQLSTPTADAVVHYTVDGTIPDHDSPVYEDSIAIESATILRARAYSSSGSAGELASWHYLIGDTSVHSFSSDLPVVLVDTLDGGVSAASPTQALIQIYDRSETGRTLLAQEPVLSEEAVIKIRGSSTEGRPKRAYNVEFQDAYGDDLDREVLGMPSESDWILYAPYNFDRALIRNAFMYELSNQLGMYAVRTRFCEVYVNSRRGRDLSQASYAGVYVLMEKIKRGADRVPVEKLLTKHTQRPEVSGGYILKIDRLDPGDSGFTGGRQSLAHVYPKEENRSSSQLSFLRNHLDAFDRALRGRTPTDPVRGYPRYIDTESFSDFHMLNEFSKNPDGLRLSTYMHIPRNGKLTMGPIWDFDRTLGPDDDARAANPNGRSSVYNFSWWGSLFQVPDFKQIYTDRWQMWREEQMTQENLMGIIDSMAVELEEAQERNFDRWNLVNGTPGWRREISQLKSWVRQRLNWFDSEFVEPPVPSAAPGVVDVGMTITFGGTDVETFFTTDGSDPRSPGGDIAQSAQLANGNEAIAVDRSLILTARSRVEERRETLWSPLFRGIYLVGEKPELVVSEIMYHPAEPPPGSAWSESDFEFIELQATGDSTADLTGVRILSGIEFKMPSRSIAKGESVLIVRNLAAFQERYPGLEGLVLGEYEGSLSNRGETIIVEDAHGRLITKVSYEDRGDWESAADGEGFSLEFNGEFSEQNQSEHWAASLVQGGTPGVRELTELMLADWSIRENRIHFEIRGIRPGSLHVQRALGGSSFVWETIAELDVEAGRRTMSFVAPLAQGSWMYRVIQP